MSAPRPLLVQPANENARPRTDPEGGGVFDGLADAAAALSSTDRNAAGIGFDVASAGVELMGTAMDPLGALASAGVGFLIEHVEFLHEPLDWLAGDPTIITAQAQTWHNVSTELAGVAGEFERAATGGMARWDGAALEAYRGAVASYTAALRGGSEHAAEVSGSISTAGALVGTTRALIRDWIAELVGDLILRGLVALATAVETFAASIAAFLVAAVASAAALAARISSRIARLLETLGRSADELRTTTVRFDRLGAEADRVARSMQRSYGAVELPVQAVTELGKNLADARDDQRQWRASGGEPPTVGG